MKRFFALAIMLSLFFCVDVYAEDNSCSNSSINSLNNQASQVQVEYSIKNEKGTYVIYTYIYNISDKIIVSYTSDVSGSVYGTVNYGMTKGGTYSFVNTNITDVEHIQFTITNINGAYGCSEQKLRSFEIIQPKRNRYFDLDICKYEAVQDYYYCKEWITTDFKYTHKQIVSKIEQEIAKNTNSNDTANDLSNELKEELGQKKEWSEQKKKTILIIIAMMGLDLILMIFQFIRIKRSEI